MTAVRRSTLLAGTCGLAALALGWWWLARPPQGFVTGMLPIDGERAVFTMRHNPDDDPSQAWIGVVGPDGVEWSQELPALTYSLDMRHGLAVGPDQVTVKVSDGDDHAQLLAFDLATGRPRWSSDPIAFAPTEYPGMLHMAHGVWPSDDGTQVLFGDHDRRTSHLVARASTDGSTLWSEDLPEHGVRQMLVSTTHVAYRHDDGWWFVRRSDGKLVHELDTYAAGCLDDSGFVTWGRDTLIEVHLAGEQPSVEARALPDEGIVGSCGRHAGALVFGVSPRQRETTGIDLVGVEPQASSIAWRISLGIWEPSSIKRGRDNEGPHANPLEGVLSDYVPVVLSSHGIDGLELAVLDLRTHAVAWRGPRDEALLHYEVFRGTPPQHFLSNGRRLIAIDGASGEVTAAVELPHEDALATHAADGRLWVYSMQYDRQNRLPWLVLDGRTLEVLARGNEDYSPVDVTEQVRTELAGP